MPNVRYDKPEILLQKFAHHSPAQIVSSIEKEIAEFSGNTLRDDVSIIVIKKSP